MLTKMAPQLNHYSSRLLITWLFNAFTIVAAIQTLRDDFIILSTPFQENTAKAVPPFLSCLDGVRNHALGEPRGSAPLLQRPLLNGNDIDTTSSTSSISYPINGTIAIGT